MAEFKHYSVMLHETVEMLDVHGDGIYVDCTLGGGGHSEEIAKKILLQPEIKILIALNQGSSNATAWGCDLTYDYVKINGDYRT